jgi:hypothetical protein
MTNADAQVMLTLAGLTYRGFQDFLPGDPHEFVVRHAVLDGLQTLAPVKGDWELVWGPVTSRVPLAVFDSSAMYVVRHQRVRHRYVIAIRGTNPIASSDWLFGDLLVGTTVRWPYAIDGAAISTSTALGLAMLQDMRARPPSIGARFAEASLAAAGNGLEQLVRAGRARVTGTTEAHAAHPSSLAAQVERIVTHWHISHASRDELREQLQRAATTVGVDPADLRRKPAPADSSGVGLDLLTFLKREADASAEALEVTVTGHSKGGALAPTVALWLKDALDAPDPGERWDVKRRALISSHAFAGPTPGNSAFANRIDQTLGQNHHHWRNMNDIVTHAWAVDDLQQIPTLYGSRSAALAPLVPGIIADVRELDYRHAQRGVVKFMGQLDPGRLFPAEVVHQHVDAYLAELGLLAQGIRAVTFFI